MSNHFLNRSLQFESPDSSIRLPFQSLPVANHGLPSLGAPLSEAKCAASRTGQATLVSQGSFEPSELTGRIARSHNDAVGAPNFFPSPASSSSENFELHSHHFVSGPRATAHYDKSGKWMETKFTHSHAGGGIPHEHPHTGPAFFGYRKPKVTSKPKGEQFQWVAIPEEEQSFDLIITDSAILNGDAGKPIGNTPIEQIVMPAADRMMGGFRLKCNVRDERTRKEVR